ncbi:MAG: hypothetical protein A2231_05170 [Candidatus Firestonebacteria bacterium RIFOXYA2_FULL_40_8]|nr:MAG: hypothetical protein A2231_05170 [Candidatus Firestonebacteria bacterium RIFOXYA2_FULL_40_8]
MKKGILWFASIMMLFALSANAAEKAKPAAKKEAPKAEEPKAEEPKAEEGSGLKAGARMILIKFDKGEMFGDGTDNGVVKSSLTKEKADKGKMYSCKIEAKKTGGEEGDGGKGLPGISKASGILSGKRGNWDNYDTLNIKYILEGEKPLTCQMLIGDASSYEKWRYGNYVERSVVLQPGENTLSLDITGLACPGGARSLDLKNMRGFGFWAPNRPEDIVLYIQDVYVEKD